MEKYNVHKILSFYGRMDGVTKAHVCSSLHGLQRINLGHIDSKVRVWRALTHTTAPSVSATRVQRSIKVCWGRVEEREGFSGWVEEGTLIPRPYSSLEQHSADILVVVGLRYPNPHTLTSLAPVFTNSLRFWFLVTTLKGSGSDAMAGVKEGFDLYEENILYFAL